ncbi:Eco57I restriction-modification methylase domain-containing protein [Candidatus Neomarinimicrobiota bacterium]
MPTDDIRQDIWDLLKDFQGDEPLKELFWSKLNYTRVNQPLSPREWTDNTRALLAENPLLFAGGDGENEDFHVVYTRMAREHNLSVTEERAVITKLLSNHLYSLFIFSDQEQVNWHFVNVRYDKDEKRRRVFRRIIIGPDVRLRTATERISMLDLEHISHGLGCDISQLTPVDIQIIHDKAFDVEAISNEFFRQYDQVFQYVEEQIQGITGEEQKRLFTQKFFNRLMFIAFIEKKGWLKYDNTADYLNELWDSYTRDRTEKSNFYNERLKHLFFSGLNNTQEVDLTEINRGGFLQTLIGEVPYLNGGLFEEEDDDRMQGIIIPDNCFRTILESLFNRFNFTVTESTPLDQEVAVDPEMLGKVFEELVTRRNETGSYYTPKVVVSFMCREALKGYLGGYANLVDDHESSNISLEEARQILQNINNVKVVDPACGSGAYLLGMLHELHALMKILDTHAEEHSARDDYQRKMSIIQNNIYGVDIDPFAVNIARLRLWLSLAVEYEGAIPEPLPHLDFKIEVGDSLTAPDPSMGGGITIDVFRQQQISRFYEVKSRYQQAYTHGEKQALLEEIGRLRLEIAEWIHPRGVIAGFDWQVEFIEVFSRQDTAGFDIVLANPPYGANVEGSLRDIYFPEGGQSKDTYGLFIARAMQLLCPGGYLTFIVSDTWRTIRTHRPLRRRLLNETKINHFIDLPAWIFRATVNTCILTLSRGTPPEEHSLIAADLRGIKQNDWDVLGKNLTAIAAHGRDLQTLNYARYTYNQALIRNYWNLSFFNASPSLHCLMNDHRFIPLSKLAQVRVGLQTGDNEYYIRKNTEARGSYEILDEKLLLTDTELAELSADEKRDGIDPEEHDGKYFVPYDKGGASETSEGWLPNYYVPTKYYIDWSTIAVQRLRTATCADVKRRRGRASQIRPRDENTLAAVIRNPEYYFRSGITFSDTGIYSPSFRQSSGSVFDQKGSIIVPTGNLSRDMLLGLLSSIWARYIYKNFVNHTVSSHVDSIKEFPCIQDPDVLGGIEEKVRQIIDKQKNDPHYEYFSSEQREIDKEIFKLYGLSDVDIREIELWYCRRYPRLAEPQGIINEVRTKYAAYLKRCIHILEEPPEYWESHPILQMIAQGEGQALEFKETLAVDADTGEIHRGVMHSALKTIAAFLNTEGGTLLIGISDSGEINGLDKDFKHCKHHNKDGFELKLRSLLKDRLEPDPIGQVGVQFEEFNENTVCRIDVLKSEEIHYLDGKDVYVRDGNTTRKIEGPTLTRLIQKRKPDA